MAKRFLLEIMVLMLALLVGSGEAAAYEPDQTPPPPTSSAATAAPTARPTQAAVVIQGAKAGELTYTVRPGDTLWLIARRFGVTVELIAKTNGFNGKKVLREGMQLHLPYSNEAGSVTMQAGVPVVRNRGLHLVASIQAQTCWVFRDGKLSDRWT
jgi:LysM repeat protein